LLAVNYSPPLARHHLVVVPLYNRSTYGRRAFFVAGPATWNSLTDILRDVSLFTVSATRSKHFSVQTKSCAFCTLEIFLPIITLKVKTRKQSSRSQCLKDTTSV